MQKRIHVLSRTMFLALMRNSKLNENNIEDMEKEGLYIISINDPIGDNMEPDFATSNKSNLLTMRFGDFRIELDEKLKNQFKKKGHDVFDDSMAIQIRDFVQKIKNNHLDDFKLLIHCHAGVSRSAAVGLYAFEELQNGTLNEFEFQNPNTAYNPIVYQKLTEI
ncbi:MAG: hypothetical protein WC979_00455 [Candidatus Pacearchaeota archaeon]|jgi:predicted protein tyrosine phosphatase|nr:hypothetical protein [Clostridia bacterium]